ncbi:Uncharacterised protein [Mycobacteroides abscessus subsp. massiliense]|nr:Uncharacterised protein [Mycobacteroides abscessus subsp. massiliense]
MRVGHLESLTTGTPARLTDRAIRAAPADHEELGVTGRIVNLQVRHRDSVDLELAQPHHEVVVGRVIRDIARAVGLLQATDAVLQTRGSGNGELTGQRLRITVVRREILVRRGEGVLDRRIACDIRDCPRLGAVGDRAVRQDHHRSPVGQCDPHGLDGDVEAVRGRTRGQHRDGGLAVAAVQGLQQVGLLGLGG